MALGKAHYGSFKILVLHYEKCFVSTGVKPHVLRKLPDMFNYELLNSSCRTTQLCLMGFILRYRDWTLCPPSCHNSGLPAQQSSGGHHGSPRRAKHPSSALRCTGTSHICIYVKILLFSHLSLSYDTYSQLLFWCGKYGKQCCIRNVTYFVNLMEEGKHSWHYGFISL